MQSSSDIYATTKNQQSGNLKEYSFFNNKNEKIFCHVLNDMVQYLNIGGEEIIGGMAKTQIKEIEDLKVYLVKFGNNEAHFQFESKKEGVDILIPANELTLARLESIFKEKSLTQTCIGKIEEKYNYSQFSKDIKKEEKSQRRPIFGKEEEKNPNSRINQSGGRDLGKQ
jgi:hypothetical protein